MSISVNVGNFIPAEVVEVGQEISVNQLAAITAATSPSAVNPFTTLGHTHIIGDVTGLQTAIDGKAGIAHTHIISNITGLQTAIDGKASVSHTHDITAISGLSSELDGKVPEAPLNTNQYARQNGAWTVVTAGGGDLSGYAPLESPTFTTRIYTPAVRNILNADLVVDSYNDTGAGTHYLHKFNPFDGRFYLATNGGGLVFPDSTIQSTAAYSKAQSDANMTTVAGWVNTKADLSHTHTISNVTGLQTALDGKASTTHNHDTVYAPIIHTHTGYATTVHTHAIADVTNLQTTLNSKLTVPQYWMEFDIGRIFTITDGVLNWDNGGSTISHPTSGSNAGSFVFNKKISCTPYAGAAGINVGIGGSGTTNGDVWIPSSGVNLWFKDGTGVNRSLVSTSSVNTFSQPQVIVTGPAATQASLRITNQATTAGVHSFVVEDAVNPDATPFVIDNNGKVGVGIAPSTAAVTVDTNGIKLSHTWDTLNGNLNQPSMAIEGITVLAEDGINRSIYIKINGLTYRLSAVQHIEI